jgi:hypothetical protein
VVDAALWARAVSLANGDEAAAVTPYLRARRNAQTRAATPGSGGSGDVATASRNPDPVPRGPGESLSRHAGQDFGRQSSLPRSARSCRSAWRPGRCSSPACRPLPRCQRRW